MLEQAKNTEFYITGSKVECYLTCPKKYYLSHVRKIQNPFIPRSPLLVFDQAIHKALSSFYKFHDKNELFDFNKLLKCLNYNWSNSSFESAEQSADYKELATNFLKVYFENYCRGEDTHADVDNFFKAKLNDVLYGGKIDRIDKNPDGSLEIIDYKTGKLPSGGTEELSESLSTQLLFASCDSLWPNMVNELTYIYLKDNQKLVVKRDPLKIQEALLKLKQITTSIQNNEFNAKASNACAFCDFRSQCPEGQTTQISLAKLRLYRECPQKYSFKYIENQATSNKNLSSPSLLFYGYFTTMLYNIFKERKIYTTQKLMNHATNAISQHKELDSATKSEILENCLKGFEFINAQLKVSGFPETIELRKELNASINEILFTLRVDRIDVLPDGKYQIVVYKTGKQAESENELKNDVNSALYWYLGREIYGDKLDSISCVYVIPGVSVAFVPNKETLELLNEDINNLVNGKTFEGCKGSLCSWCDYYGPCPKWKIKPHEMVNESLEEFRKRIRLSYSKMSLYINCPRAYKKVYVDGIKSKPQPYFDFGTAIHETFENIYNPDRVWKVIPSLDDFTGEYEKVRLKYRAGMSTPEIEEDYHQDGIRQLSLYYNRFVKDMPFNNAYAIEEYFEIPCGKYAVMTGFIDRIDKLDDGTFEILDYKTEPTLRSQEEVDHDKQLSIYFMAAEQTLGLKISKLSLLMLDHDKKIETTRNTDDIPSLIEAIDKTAYQMLNEKEYHPRKNKYCKSCDHLSDCPLREEILSDKELVSMQKFGEEQ